MDNRFGEMQVFQRVVEHESFSAAARVLQMTPSTVSKLVQRLEARLQVRLIERSTRRLVLTTEGQHYYDRCHQLLNDLEEIEQSLTTDASQISGIVRVNASVGFGTHAVETLLPEFWRTHPNIVVDLSLSDEIVDLYLDHTDVAFRVGAMTSSSLTAIKLGTAQRMIVGSPAYLERHGTPQSVEDLAHHTCLGLNFRRSVPIWPLKEKGQPVEHKLESPLLANNGETLRRLACAGVGLARLGEFHVRRDLKEGQLRAVLDEASQEDTEDVHAVFIGGIHMACRVRAFLDFMVPRLRDFIKDR